MPRETPRGGGAALARAARWSPHLGRLEIAAPGRGHGRCSTGGGANEGPGVRRAHPAAPAGARGPDAGPCA
eukprot:14873452-Alexandrium_andersonii.AAC.1